MPDYAYKERVAIKMDSHLSEREAIRQTEKEMAEPECLQIIKRLEQKAKMKHAEQQLKRARRLPDD